MTNRKFFGATAAFAVASLLMAGVVPGAWAQATRANIEIPFDFYVEATSMPAGNYWIEHDSKMGATRIVGPNGHAAAVLPLASTRPATDKTRLVFHRYGNTHFLSEMQWAFSSTAVKVRESELEREARLTKPPLRVSVSPANGPETI